MKMTFKAREIIDAASKEARFRKQEYLMPEHLLFAALSSQECRDVLSACDVNNEFLFEKSKKERDKNRMIIQEVNYEN